MDTVCADCGENKGTIKFSDHPLMTLTHGLGGRLMCKNCYLKRLEEHREELNKTIKKLREEVGCGNV